MDDGETEYTLTRGEIMEWVEETLERELSTRIPQIEKMLFDKMLKLRKDLTGNVENIIDKKTD